MLNYDVHAEAQARFTAATSGVSSKQTTVNNVLKGIDISELVIDDIQTHDFIRKGTCREVDPLAKPFVHYTPFTVAASGLVAYGITRLPHSKLVTVLLGTFAVGEALGVLHNHTEGCE